MLEYIHELLNIQKEIPDILLDIRYCTTYNFIGEIIDGYIDPVALGTKELVKQLSNQFKGKTNGISIKDMGCLSTAKCP